MDERLRALFRAWEAGDTAAGRQAVVERLRTGQLSRDALRMGAYLGHEGCRGALGEDALSLLAQASGVDGFVGGIPAPDLEVVLRARLAVLRSYLPSVDAGIYADAVEALEAWAACPCPAHITPALGSREAVDRTAAEWNDKVRSVMNTSGYLPACQVLNCLVALQSTLRWLAEVIRNPQYPKERVTLGSDRTRRLDGAAIEAVRAALLPWALLRPEGRPAAWAVPDWEKRRLALRHTAEWDEERAVPPPRPEEVLFGGGHLPEPIARALIAETPEAWLDKGSVSSSQAEQLVSSYLAAAGWKDTGWDGGWGTWVAPSGARRLRVQKRVAVLEVREGKRWGTNPGWGLATIPLDKWGTLILEAVARAARGAGDEAPAAPARSFGPAPKPVKKASASKPVKKARKKAPARKPKAAARKRK